MEAPSDDQPDDGAGHREPLRSDPETGSTPTDPAAETSGPPPAGDDPMAGEAPSS